MADVDYGNDIECVSDMTFAMRTVDGEEMMAQVAARRLQVIRGEYFPDPEYGFDLRQFLLGTEPIPSVINGGVENELLKDGRISDVDVDTSYNAEAESLTVKVQAFGAEGPFALTLLVTDVTVELLRESTT